MLCHHHHRRQRRRIARARSIIAENVFLTEDGRVKIGDLGVSKFLDSRHAFTRTFVGTPYYLSPEARLLLFFFLGGKGGTVLLLRDLHVGRANPRTVLSPQICESVPYNNKSDVWALGVILYELMALRPPFHAQSQAQLLFKIIRGKYPPPPARYSNDLRELSDRLLARNPEERPAVAEILLDPVVKSRAIALQGERVSG